MLAKAEENILEPEDPSPRRLLTYQPSKNRTKETRHGCYAGYDGRIERVLVRCTHFWENDEGHSIHYTTADAL